MEIDIINALPIELFVLIGVLRHPVFKVQEEITERRLHKRRDENFVKDTGENGYKRRGEDRRALERIMKL